MVYLKGQEIPDHLWELGLAVRSLIEQYEAMESWRRHVRGWVKLVREAAEKPNYTGVDVMDLPLAPEIDEEYVLLAVVHDNCASPERNEELIHPWAAEADFGGSEEVDLNSEALDAIATYVGLMQHVLPQQGRRGIERSKADRLLKILRHVANDIRNAARFLTPDRSICVDESVPDPVEEYASFLRRDSGSEDVRTDLTRPKVQEADDSEAPVVDGEQANQADERAAGGEGTPQAELNRETYSPDLVGNRIDDPSGPLTCAQIAGILWDKASDAEKSKALRWMKKGKLPANLADAPKDHYCVSKSQLDLLEKGERTKRKESNS